MKSDSCVVLLSGGLDSTTLLALALEEFDRVMALTLFYKQRHVREIEAAMEVAKYYKVLHRVVDISNISPLIQGSALTSDDIDVPEGHYTDSTIFENTPAFFVNAYLEKTEDDSVTISIYNYFPADIILLGTGYNNKYVTSYQVPEPELKAYRGDEVSHTEIVTDTGSVYLFFMVPEINSGTECLESPGYISLAKIRTTYLVSKVDKEFRNSAHTDTTNPNKMNMSELFKQLRTHMNHLAEFSNHFPVRIYVKNNTYTNEIHDQ